MRVEDLADPADFDAAGTAAPSLLGFREPACIGIAYAHGSALLGNGTPHDLQICDFITGQHC